MDINLRLKEIIESRGIKQAFICSKINMTADTLSKILNGSRKITGEELLNLCDFLEIDPRILRKST
jgi:transcriptional regulator with XRE-family HTH domain